MESRPKIVPIIAAFLFAATAIAAVVAVSIFFPGRLLDSLWQFNRPGEAAFRAVGKLSGIFLLLVGAATCCAAIGLLRGRKWAWRFAVGLFLVDICGNVVSLAVTGEWVKDVTGIAVSSLFLYCLSRPAVRRHTGAMRRPLREEETE
jgi:hypothetical protein